VNMCIFQIDSVWKIKEKCWELKNI
jgi:hypothetical protein